MADRKLAWSGHGEELVKFVSYGLQRHSNTILSVQGENIPVNNMVLASASPFLAGLLSSRNHDKIIIEGVAVSQVRLLVDFMYRGTIDGVSESDIADLLAVARELQILGVLSSVKHPVQEEEEEEEAVDDVFAEETVVDLSPNIKSSVESKQRSATSDILPRIKKPRPLTNLSVGEDHPPGQPLKLRTPRTPLLVSPDCRALEERFRDLISGCTPEQQENLRNLSVSSADFNFEIGSLPATPVNKNRNFNIPGPDHLKQENGLSLDLSFKGVESIQEHRIPAINIVKPEPSEQDNSSIAEEETDMPSVQSNISVKSERTTDDDIQDRGRFFFPNLNLPLVLPYPQYMFNRMEPRESPLIRDFKSTFTSNPHSAFTPPRSDESSKVQLLDSTKPKQVYKCEKCGKCYNWNYNLNRHMRFECGIENKFECAICKKRFPYKQNAAIHLKRKHKVMLETADDMLGAGQIVHISSIPKTST